MPIFSLIYAGSKVFSGDNLDDVCKMSITVGIRIRKGKTGIAPGFTWQASF
jgi:hypothetical protein